MKIATLAITLVVTLAGAAHGQVVTEISRRQAIHHYRAGVELMTAERWEQAAAEFTEAIGLDPLLALAHYNLGQSYMALRRYASAVLAFTRCRDAYEQIGALRQRHQEEALSRLTDEMNELRDSIRRLQSGSVSVSAGASFRMERRLEELETMSKAGILVAPRIVPAELLLALGSAYFRNGQQSDAEREWKAAVEANGRLGEAHNNLAALYAMTRRPQAAREALDAAERAGFRVNPRLKADVAKMQ